MCQNDGLFNRRNREKLQEAKSGEWGGWETTVMLFFVKDSLMKKEV
jgi:hypothetical protein